MNAALKLTVYFGESDRLAHGLLSDALLDVFEEHQLHAAVLMRAVAGFGIKQTLRTDRLLTLSEDLPLVAVAVDERSAIERVWPRVQELVSGGLLTLERARFVQGALDSIEVPEELHEAVKLTIYLGRDERVRGRPVFLEVVDELYRHGIAGATVFLGVDGMWHRRRERARFFSRNESVPVMIVSVGDRVTIAEALAALAPLLRDPVVTLERVRVCKREGVRLAEPRELPDRDDEGLTLWQKLMVYASEQARYRNRPLSLELLRRLRAEGASGATTLRGIWGFSGARAPHGDRLFRIRRDVPVVTTVIDTPERIRRWFEIVDEVTAEAGIVTSEVVPALHAIAPERSVGGLRLARRRV